MLKKWLIGILALLILVYFLGPSPEAPEYALKLPSVPGGSTELDDYVRQNESRFKIKPDNEARIIWADSTRQKTEFSIIYLHGFSASQAEGDPVHKDIAKRFHCNLYLSRLADHGIDTSEPLLNYGPESSWESAKQAYAIGKQLGKKVIVMGTSTGGTLALMLAAAYPDIHSIILLSPNIAINDPAARILNNHWGLQIARTVLGGNYVLSKDQRPVYKNYWYSKYRVEGAVGLEELLETSMTKETFEKVTQPALCLYYYRDEIHQDSVVKVSAIVEMMKQLGTPEDLKRSIPMPNAGDHVLGSYIKSKDLNGVEAEIENFIGTVLKLPSH